MKYKFSGVPLTHHDSAQQIHSQRAFLALTALAAATGLGILWNVPRTSQNEVETLQPALGAVSAIAKNFNQSQIKPLEAAVPGGWKTNQIAAGVVAYSVPAEEVETIADPVAPSASAGSTLDGTRFPYVSEVRGSDLLANPIAPGIYQWTNTWEGEGYSREYDRQGQLVAEREGGVDINVTFTYNSNVKDPTKPNLTIKVQNNQDKTGQLTNLSAFLNDPETGAAIDRQDFAQLPPTYDVTATRNGGFGGTEIKTLDPLGTVTFAYRVSLDELNRQPIKLQGINRYFNERLQEIASLEAQGWIVKEVPAAR
ncbi:MAG: hypothetical protein KME11_07760 [Timaviella obliquedivisa GSE-PSE-MK23-08B]|jgi:hypothetical protein|nr:hypothetical protein [Timaviella obliquedivisa GSE-PSE-MK23-08B]